MTGKEASWEGGVFVVVAVAAAALSAPAVALGVDVAYWGFNYLSSANPNVSDCNDGHYIACSGWNNWDRTQIDKRNGGYVGIYHRADDGNYWTVNAIGGIGVFNYSRNYINSSIAGFGVFIPQYNRAGCKYISGNQSYGQCQAVIY